MNCSICGQLARMGDQVEMRIQGKVINPLKNNVGASIGEIEWVPGTFRHRHCQYTKESNADEETG